MVMEDNVEATFPKIISVDDHVIEHRNVWLDRLPAKYHDVGPRTIQERGTMQFVGGNFSYQPTEDGELCEVARLSGENAAGRLGVWVSAAFREVLLFTPAHRRSVAIEPYTCASDGMNLGGRGIDAGWLVLDPGQVHTSAVEYRWEK